MKPCYYKDLKLSTTGKDVIALCRFNDTDEPIRFFSAVFGPHGHAEPGTWQCEDSYGFSIEVSDQEFKTRYQPTEKPNA
jgi:hypothetical protein